MYVYKGPACVFIYEYVYIHCVYADMYMYMYIGHIAYYCYICVCINTIILYNYDTIRVM